MKNFITLFVVCLLLSCCATTMMTNNLNVGMTKQEVIKIMGQPVMSKANGNKEVLEYMLAPEGYIADQRNQVQYWIVL